MKPRVFVGSSTESLNIAYAIQENLEHDANVTVWTQGVFQLTSNALDDLLVILNDIDFGIFVFSPDDIVTIRNVTKTVTRDNVIFELGLFIGRLGKENVFFIVPYESEDLKIPTDLLGVAPGRYFSNREDGNLKAALGPFCNQVREKIKGFVYESIHDIENESREVKHLALNKPLYWTQLMLAALLENNLQPILKSYEELKKGIVFIPTKQYINHSDFLSDIAILLKDYMRLVNVFLPLMSKEFVDVLNREVPSPIEIKSYTDQVIRYKELLEWEYRLEQIEFPTQYIDTKEGFSDIAYYTLNKISKIPSIMRNRIQAKINNEDLNRPDLMLNDIFALDKITKLTESFSILHPNS